MVILAIDTATRFTGVALCENDTVLAEYLSQSKLSHSKRLLPTIDALLSDVQRKPNEIEAIAVSSGPGSFTGLRIGMALAKGMAQALDIPIVGIGSLEHWAASRAVSASPTNSNSELLVLPLLDAQRDEFYAGLYSYNGGVLIQKIEPAARSKDALISVLQEYRSSAICVTGDILPHRLQEINELFEGWQCYIDIYNAVPRPAALAQLALQRINAGISDNLFALTPKYLRLSEAERQRLAKNQSRSEVDDNREA